MSKKLFATTALVALSVCGAALTSFAEDKADATKAENTANVTVLPGDKDEVNPPIDPEIDPPTGQKGDLTVDTIINFKFNDVKLQNTDFKTGLKPTDKKHGIQVTDKRGTGDGWTLRLTQNKMMNTDSSVAANSNKSELKGAYISLPLVEDEAHIHTTLNNPGKDMKPKSLNYKFNGTYGAPQNVATAAKDHGMGSWLFRYNTGENDKVELNIPAGNYAGTYEGIMQWTLAPTPATDSAK